MTFTSKARNGHIGMKAGFVLWQSVGLLLPRRPKQAIKVHKTWAKAMAEMWERIEADDGKLFAAYCARRDRLLAEELQRSQAGKAGDGDTAEDADEGSDANEEDAEASDGEEKEAPVERVRRKRLLDPSLLRMHRLHPRLPSPRRPGGQRRPRRQRLCRHWSLQQPPLHSHRLPLRRRVHRPRRLPLPPAVRGSPSSPPTASGRTPSRATAGAAECSA